MTSTHPVSRGPASHIVHGVAWATATVVVALSGCNEEPLQPMPLALLFTCDMSGWIVPCGCAANQAGGLARRATYVAQTRETSDVLLADVGGAAGGVSAYEREKFEAILLGEVAMGVAAHNLGAAEAALGTEYLQEVSRRIAVPLVSTNLLGTDGQSLVPRVRIVPVAGRRVALLGVLSPALAPQEVVANPPLGAVLDALREADGEYDLAVVLAYLPEEELGVFARQLPEVDLVIGGPTGQSLPPQRLGPTLLAAVTNKGKFVARVDATSTGLRGSTFVELGPDFADHPQQRANLEQFYERLGRADFAADSTGLGRRARLAWPPEHRVAGTEACRICHQQDCQAWENSKHAHAWATLIAKRAEVDSYCQQCHTTGFGVPGGFVSAKRSGPLVNVGCESCHGPGQTHVENPRRRVPFAAKDQCVTCHDRENSPGFDYVEYWKQISHGYPANEAAVAKSSPSAQEN